MDASASRRLRIIVVEVDASDVPHVGGPAHQTFRTFAVDASPELLAFLDGAGLLIRRSIVGVAIDPTTGDPT